MTILRRGDRLFEARQAKRGVRGTPASFFFGPYGSAYLPGAYPFSSFQHIIDSLLDGRTGRMDSRLCGNDG